MPKLVAQAEYGDLDARKLTDASGNVLTLPPLTQGDTWQHQMRFLQREQGGDSDEPSERKLNVRSIRATIGQTMEPPTGGQFALLGSGDEALTAFDFNTEATVMRTALHAAFTAGKLPYDCLEVKTDAAAPCCWMVRFDHDAAVTLTEAPDTNTLAPESFVRLRAVKESGVWWVEMRLIQTPLAMTSAHTLVLPAGPSRRQIQEGEPESPGVTGVNEIQALTVPDDFEGTYTSTFAFRRTTVLAADAGPDEIAEALNGLYTDGKTRFKVTNPEKENAYIEFVGELGKAAQSLITVTVNSFAAGVLTFLLKLNGSRLASVLRTAPSVTDLYEVEVQYVEDNEDAEDDAVESKIITFKAPVTIEREQIYDELATVEEPDWLLPIPRSYVPFGLNNVITGTQNYRITIGDATNLEYSITHNLGTGDLQAPAVYERATGRLLTPGGEYEMELPTTGSVPSTSAVNFFFAEAPPVGGMRVVLTSAGPKSAFMEGLTVTIGQVTGLQDMLDDQAEVITAIQGQLAYTTPGVPVDSASAVEEIAIQPKAREWPGKFAAGARFENPQVPTKLGILLPALHVTSVTTRDFGGSGVPALATAAGKVYRNTGSDAVLLPAGRGWKSPQIEPNQLVGCDGRIWYRVEQQGSTKTYHPSDMTEELFLLAINDRMLRPGHGVTLDFRLAVQGVATNTRLQWVLVVETGSVPQATTPTPIGVNLSDVVWSATPLLAQRIILSSVPEIGRFGATIRRAVDNALTADRIVYGVAEAANDGAPSTANFVIRAKLCEADTEDSVAKAAGAAWYSLTEGKASFA